MEMDDNYKKTTWLWIKEIENWEEFDEDREWIWIKNSNFLYKFHFKD